MFEHYIICRYNLTLFSENVYGVKDPEGWMKRRFYWFKYLIASLKSQSCKKFTFVVLMDRNTPDVFIHEIRNEILPLKGAYVFFGNHLDWLKDVEFKKEWLITSRIDCDDYYEHNFVKVIQRNFRQENEILDVVGLQFDALEGEFYTSGRKRPNSPFISLVEETNNPVTVFESPHTNMADRYPARFVSEDPLYVQIIHDENISNKIQGMRL